jgi:hypothetical protein
MVNALEFKFSRVLSSRLTVHLVLLTHVFPRALSIVSNFIKRLKMSFNSFTHWSTSSLYSVIDNDLIEFCDNVLF